MTYRVEMIRSPGITDAEARQRLAQVYRLLLDLAHCAKTETADDGNLGRGASPAASDARPEGRDAEGL